MVVVDVDCCGWIIDCGSTRSLLVLLWMAEAGLLVWGCVMRLSWGESGPRLALGSGSGWLAVWLVAPWIEGTREFPLCWSWFGGTNSGNRIIIRLSSNPWNGEERNVCLYVWKCALLRKNSFIPRNWREHVCQWEDRQWICKTNENTFINNIITNFIKLGCKMCAKKGTGIEIYAQRFPNIIKFMFVFRGCSWLYSYYSYGQPNIKGYSHYKLEWIRLIFSGFQFQWILISELAIVRPGACTWST